MAHDRWAAFVDWLAAEEILTTVDEESLPAAAAPPTELYTNELLGEATA